MRTYVRLDRSNYETLKKGAERKGLTISSYMRMLLLERLAQINDEKETKSPDTGQESKR